MIARRSPDRLRRTAHFRWLVGLGVADVSGETAGFTGVTLDQVAAIATMATSRATKTPTRTRRFMRGFGLPCGIGHAEEPPRNRREGRWIPASARAATQSPGAGPPDGRHDGRHHGRHHGQHDGRYGPGRSSGSPALPGPRSRARADAARAARASSRQTVVSSGMTEAHQ
jgi:hypothetical protein